MSSNLRDWSPGLLQIVNEATAIPEVVVLNDPSRETLETCALDTRLAVLAIVPGPAEARAQALRAGALDAIDPRLPEVEVRARIECAIQRFRATRQTEDAQTILDRQASFLRRDLLLAAKLQRSFLPRAVPEVPGYRFATVYVPREVISGDLYDLRVLEPGRVALWTMDAMGHGIGSALLSVMLRSLIRPVEPGPRGPRARSPSLVLAELDEALREAELVDSPTAAFCYGLLDAPGRRLAVANAGHPLPLRLRADGQMEQIGTTCLLLGVVAEEYETVEVELAPGDRVYFHTDGAEPEYGRKLQDELVSRRALGLAEQVEGALAAVVPLDGSATREDDVTVVALEVLGAPDGIHDGRA